MKIKIITSILSVIFWSELFSQFEFEFSGYITSTPIYQINNIDIAKQYNLEENQFIDLSRVRLRPTLYFGEKTRLNIDYEISSMYYFYDLLIPLSNEKKNSRQVINLNWNIVNNKHLVINHFIDRLYFHQEFDYGELRIGRQRISWGTGRIWNPNDLFNPINPASFYKIEKDGADVASFKLFLGDFSDLHFVFNPQERFKESNYAVRYRTNFLEFDFSLMGGKFDSQIIGGMDFAGNLLDAGFRGEFVFSGSGDDSFTYFVKSILGIDYQFTPELYALIEYYYNGQGVTDKSSYQFNKLITGEILNLNQNYLFEMVSYLITPLLNISVSNNTNINDSSGYIGLIGNYSLIDDLNFIFGLQLIYGSILSEYWYYPTSIYLQGEYYF
ncbi:MAG: hypothetical protein JXA68_07895 [Ignavibacteriales bacterium]|nr:hypothetical protein [Ignavibacteriales bacterium]